MCGFQETNDELTWREEEKKKKKALEERGERGELRRSSHSSRIFRSKEAVFIVEGDEPIISLVTTVTYSGHDGPGRVWADEEN
ncbi:hypothetical protein OUZ56_018844 [Daphnia magna]|uniref:Uncharacterized protein n=1 Tax=Daphnia magna TaxID=35525 RepID=A0ABQ9Z9X3_9CRUS|nr:hypothetical protein OUZ56_018844 [Daphnia magna]